MRSYVWIEACLPSEESPSESLLPAGSTSVWKLAALFKVVAGTMINIWISAGSKSACAVNEYSN
jgi:hypothetical protein